MPLAFYIQYSIDPAQLLQSFAKMNRDWEDGTCGATDSVNGSRMQQPVAADANQLTNKSSGTSSNESSCYDKVLSGHAFAKEE